MEQKNYHRHVIAEDNSKDKLRAFVSLSQFVLAVLIQVVAIVIAITMIAAKTNANTKSIDKLELGDERFKVEVTNNQKEILDKLDVIKEKFDEKLERKKDKNTY
ncbi:hypothetical protein GAMM_230017 [Gammaproteobacteria bacterium]